VELAELLAHQLAGDLREPEVDPGDQAEQRPTEQHVVEVGDHVVGVVLLGVVGTIAWVTPDSPPMVNIDTKPIENSIGV
jgi:hypothetical protein